MTREPENQNSRNVRSGKLQVPDVAFWHLTDIPMYLADVRFDVLSIHGVDPLECS